jgi:hypothetical protein
MSVAQVLSTAPLNVSFRRALVGKNWEDWLDLVGKVMTVTLTEHKDFSVGRPIRLFRLRTYIMT